MSGVVTLAERHRRKMERRTRAIAAIDAALVAYARERGGRFIRYGSTAEGRMRDHSDVDIIADFGDPEATFDATLFAEDLCFRHEMKPDVRPAYFVSARFLEAAAERGIMLL